MKKEYGTPKAEKVTFDYSEVVVASNTVCKWVQEDTEAGRGCKDNYYGDGRWTEAEP